MCYPPFYVGKRGIRIGVIVVLLLLATGCGSAPTPTATPTNTPSPTLTSTPTSAFTPTPLPQPKAGHWKGDNVSFDVTDGETLYNFRLTTGNSFSGCEFTFNSVVLEPDGGFQRGGKSRNGDGTPEFIANTFTGKLISSTEMSGEYSKILYCGNSVFFSTGIGGWKATWASSEVTPTPSLTPTLPPTATP